MKFRTKHLAFCCALVVLACAVLLLRVALARSIRDQVEGHFRTMTGYEGRISGVGISLWRAAYRINGMVITKKDGAVKTPLFEAPWIDVGLQWPELLKGRLVARVIVGDGRLNFVGGPSRNQSQAGRGQDWLLILAGLAPVRINQFVLQGGEIHFLDPYGKPPVDVEMKDVHMVAGDLYVKSDGRNAYPGSITAGARVMDEAGLSFHAAFDPYAPTPSFHYKAGLDGLKLARLNPLFQRYSGMQVTAGVVDIDSQGQGSGGDFHGYIKPTIVGLRMKKTDQLDPRIMIRKLVLGILVLAFTSKHDQLMAKFEFKGAFKDPTTTIWTAPAYIFVHGFTKAIPHGLAGAALMEGIRKKAGK